MFKSVYDNAFEEQPNDVSVYAFVEIPTEALTFESFPKNLRYVGATKCAPHRTSEHKHGLERNKGDRVIDLRHLLLYF